MWHEARKQEKKIREAVVDLKKRAERRRQHYAKQRRDPMQLLRVYGAKIPLHLDPVASKMSSSLIPWQEDESNMISRYDARVNLDYMPDYSSLPRPTRSVSEEWEEQRCNYERYRFLVLNQFKLVSEQEALAAIEVSETYHIPGKPYSSSSSSRDKSKSQARAAIGYSYGGEDGETDQARRDEQLLAEYLGEDEGDEEKAFSSESEYEMDVDLDCYSSVDVDRLNVLALEYGIAASSFSKNLRSEKRHMEQAKLARISDLEKAAMPGRRSRRERRQMRERAPPRISTPPTYAQRNSPTYEPYRPESRSRSSSHSSSPGDGRVEFITEFGGDDEVGVATPSLDHTHQSTSHEAVPESARNENQTREKSRSSRRRDSHSHSPRNRGSHSHSPRRQDFRSHSPRRRDSHSRSPRRRGSHSRSPRRRGSHSRSPRRRGSHSRSPKRRSSNHRESRSRSRSREHGHRRSRPSSSRERKRRSRSRSSERAHIHQSSVAVTTSGDTTPTQKNKSPRGSKSSGKAVKDKVQLTPQERLKKKMQAQLSRQFKQDKKLQKEKEHKKESERIEREEEMQDKMRKLRGRNWEREGYRSRSPSPYGYTSAQYGRYT